MAEKILSIYSSTGCYGKIRRKEGLSLGPYIRRFGRPDELVQALQRLPGTLWPELLHYAEPHENPLVSLISAMQLAGENGSGAKFTVHTSELELMSVTFVTPTWHLELHPTALQPGCLYTLKLMRLRGGQPDPTFALSSEEGWFTVEQLMRMEQIADIQSSRRIA